MINFFLGVYVGGLVTILVMALYFAVKDKNRKF